jgi:hypothetical protein
VSGGQRAASEIVLAAISPGCRITTRAWRSSDDDDLRLGIDLLDHVLYARFHSRHQLRHCNGKPIDWRVLPVTGGFLQRAAAKLGTPLGIKHAYQVARRLRADALAPHDFFKSSGARKYFIYRLKEVFLSPLSQATLQADSLSAIDDLSSLIGLRGATKTRQERAP